MNAAVNSGKVIYSITWTRNHGIQKAALGLRFFATLNLRNAAIFYTETDRFFEERRYANIAGPPTEHSIENNDALTATHFEKTPL